MPISVVVPEKLPGKGEEEGEEVTLTWLLATFIY